MGLKDRTYLLTPNHASDYPSEILYFDTETNFDPELKDQIHTLRLGIATVQRYQEGSPVGLSKTYEFRTANQFWTLVESRLRAHRNLWIIAHNLDFDFAAVEGFGQLGRRGYDVSFWAFAPSLFLLRARKDKKGIQFADSMGYLKASLSTLGKRFGLEKLPMPDTTASDGAWRTYCERDVAVLKLSFETLMQFLRERDFGHLSLTIPGQAITAYRHRFMHERIVIHRTPHLLPVELASYHGGRTEAFFIGHVPSDAIYYLDINSMYGSVMRDGAYPCQLLGTRINPSPMILQEALRRYEVLADCDVDLDEPIIPHMDEKLTFPVGKFRTILAGPELRMCYERGHVRKVYGIIIYRRGYPFKEYVEYFWEQRQRAKAEGDDTTAYLSKLMQNSLYGKFGQRNPVYKTVRADPLKPAGIETVISAATGRRESRLTFAGRTWIKTHEEASRWSSYPIASWVTSYARVKLNALIEGAGRDHVYYCDTDSVFVDQTGHDRLSALLNPSTLGALSVKGEGSDLTIHGAKDYVLDGEIKLKGVPRSAIEVEPGTYEYWTFERTRTRLHKGIPDAVSQVSKRKTLSREYDKGTVTASGWVEPYRLPRT